MTRVSLLRARVLCALMLALALVWPAAAAAAPSVTEFTGGVTPGLSANASPNGIAAGPDGNLWFTELNGAGGVARITPAGAVTEFTGGVTPGFTANAGPLAIAAGPDGNLWFTEFRNPGRVARITPAGAVTEFTGGVTPGFSANAGPTEIVAGPDGNLWFTENGNPGRVARITPAGAVTEFTGGVTPGFTANAGPQGIAAGPDGNLWFTEYNGPGRVARITPAGAVTEFTGGVTPGFTANANPFGIAAGPDGNLWFTENGNPGRVARITPAGAVTEFTGGVTPGFTANAGPQGIAAGPDGNLWFTENYDAGRVARITPAGAVTEFTGGVTPGFTANAYPAGIAAGPDGNLWFTENNDPGRVARLTTAQSPPSNISPPSLPSSRNAGQTVVCNPGAWTASPTSFDFSWTRDGVTIADESASSYKLRAGDAGHTIRCRVVAHNAGGPSPAATSNALSVTNLPPSNTSPPTIPSTGKVGNTVTCNPGAWTNAPTSFAYGWTFDGSSIANQHAKTYKLGAGDAAHKIRCQVVAHNSGGNSAQATSNALAVKRPPSNCKDKTPPKSAINKPKAAFANGKLLLKGTASDVACGKPGKVVRVIVTIARHLDASKGSNRCRFLLENGRALGPVRGCDGKPPIVFPATGTKKWSLTMAATPPKATYTIRSRAIDAAGNVEAVKSKGPNVVKLKRGAGAAAAGR